MASTVKIYDVAKDNYTAIQSVNNNIEINAYTASGVVDSNVTKIKTTNSYLEVVNGSNLYYTGERVAAIVSASNVLSSNYISGVGSDISNKVMGLTADQIAASSGYNYIVNGVYSNNLILGSRLTASNLNVTGARTVVNTIKYETECMLS